MGFKSPAYFYVSWKFSQLIVVLFKKSFIIYSSCKICNYLSIHPNFLVKLYHFNFVFNAYYNYNLCLHIIIYFSGPSVLFFLAPPLVIFNPIAFALLGKSYEYMLSNFSSLIDCQIIERLSGSLHLFFFIWKEWRRWRRRREGERWVMMRRRRKVGVLFRIQ
jgi:hypothetical protein